MTSTTGNPLLARLQCRTTTTSRDSHPPLFEYELIEGVERLERYQPGGYDPLAIGDVLQGRYKVVHKLGYGTYSTTWLCRDGQFNRYVAVKVGTGDSNPREAGILDSLTSACSVLNQRGKGMIPTIQDRFVLHGPNGSHPCYVTAPAMCSISGAKDGSYKRLFQAGTARSLIVQLVLAVEYLHAKGVVHGSMYGLHVWNTLVYIYADVSPASPMGMSDLHLGNVLLRLPTDFDQLSIEQFYEKYGSPDLQPVVRLDGKALKSGVPYNVAPPVWLGKASEDFSPSEAQVLLSDFGEVYLPATERRYWSHTPLSFAPPEARFEPQQSLSFSSDTWSLACAIWAILGQRHLFDDFLTTQDDILAEQIDVLGGLPQEWWGKWEARQEYFSESGEPKKDRHVRSWEDRFEAHIQRPRRDAGIPGFDLEEKAAVSDMLQSMLSFRPERRPTMGELLKCDWMVKWGLPEYTLRTA